MLHIPSDAAGLVALGVLIRVGTVRNVATVSKLPPLEMSIIPVHYG